MATNGEKAEFKCLDAQVKIGDKFVPLGKVEEIKLVKPGEEIPLETTGIDMTGFMVAARNFELTMDMTTPNPLKLKLTLMGIPVVNIITCKNCVKRHTTRCPAWRSNFVDNDTCSRGELKI